MQFIYQERAVILKALTQVDLIEERSLHQGSQLEKKWAFLHVLEKEIEAEQEIMEGYSSNVQALLQFYGDVFQEPKGLTPT